MESKVYLSAAQLCPCCVVVPYFAFLVLASHCVPILSVLLKTRFELFTLSTA